jgi:hypothetical protein
LAVLIRNTTDIPNRLIEIAVAFSIQEGVDIKEIVIKNKKDGKTHGQWGWYFPNEKRVVLIVPQSIPEHGVRCPLKYSGLMVRVMTRAEFVIAVMAHELRHGWQWQIASNSFKLSKPLRERDAEQYEYGMLAKWRAQFNQRVSAA